ncbi:MAG TPA: hypothetical protein PKM50_00625 [Methanoregula sp.]|nr:hypothetical protein [Methanoregula sp.]
MAGKIGRRKKNRGLSTGDICDLLLSALRNREDFILTREPRPGEEAGSGTEPVIHILTGNLITACRLNGLLGRVRLYEDEGARIITVREQDISDKT